MKQTIQIFVVCILLPAIMFMIFIAGFNEGKDYANHQWEVKKTLEDIDRARNALNDLERRYERLRAKPKLNGSI